MLLLVVGGLVGAGVALGVGLVGAGVTLGAGAVVVAAGFSAGFKRPILMFPAKDGMFFLPPFLPITLGTLLSLTVFLLTTASAVLFLAPPLGPGHPSHPSLVSLRSPSQVG